MTDCPKCKSRKVTAGALAETGRSLRASISFVPGQLKWYQFSMQAGAELQTEAFACPDCGLVWTTAKYPEVLREVINRYPKTE